MDIRSVVPSQLIAESGSDIIVINLGSANLRIGPAIRDSPLVIPHCIAHKVLAAMDGVVGEVQRKKGSVAEQRVSTNPVSAARRAERDEICGMVELQLKMSPFIPDEESPKGHGEAWTITELDEDESFPWTQVMVENPAFQGDATAAEPMVITTSLVEDGHLPTSSTQSAEVSDLRTGQNPEKEVEQESGREIFEEHRQEIVEGLKEETPIEREEEVVEDSEEEDRKEPEEQIVEDSEEGPRKETEEEVVKDSGEGVRKEPEEQIVEDSKEGPRKEPEEQIVEDSEEEAQKQPEEEIVEDSEDETRKETKQEIVEDSEEETRKETETAIQKIFERESSKEPELESPANPDLEVDAGSDLEIHVVVRIEPEEPSTSNIEPMIQKPAQSPFHYRKYICGEEALNIAATEPYVLRRPICRGHLNVTQQYSLQQVCDDLYSIWDWVLTERLSLDSKTRDQFSAVLVVPDTLDNREIKELLSIILRDLRFRSAVVHQESVAATFGNGISSACVVNMGAQVTSIDGVALPTTRIVLPFGGEDISRCLLWVQQRWQTWPPIDTDPLHDPLDLNILEHIKESHCLMIEGDQSAVTEIPLHKAGTPTLIYRGSLKALNVPVMGLFYPSLLAPEEYAAPLRPGFHIDHEDVLDDFVEASRKSDIAELAPPPLGNGGASSVAWSEVAADDTTGSQGPGPEESALGLSRAIVHSIMSTGRADLQKKLFASIQLVGGTAYIRGLVDAVEERVLHDIPAHEAVDTVAVLQNRTEAPIACWKGGAVLGILDFSRDAWVHHDDWVTGGVRLGCGRKYKDSYTLHSQAFYYSAAVE